METNFNFNSQVCTSKVQSERLLALGLKEETADCYWFYCDIAKEWKCTILSSIQVFKDYPTTVIPAWSLHRLMEMCDVVIRIFKKRVSLSSGEGFNAEETLYDNLINCIEWLIKEGYFPKENLV